MSTVRTLKLNKDLPYIVAARKEGYWDSVMNIYPTADTSYSITMDAYDGLSAKYSESYQSADTIDFSETILPWKIQYSNLLETSKFCLMPYGGDGFVYKNIIPTKDAYNFNVVGSPTINNTTKVVSDFSTSNYLQLQEPFNPGNNPWEVVVKFKTGSNVTSVQQIFQSCLGTGNAGRYGININIDSSSKFNFFCSSSGSSWLFDTFGTHIVQANTDYIIKIGWTGTEYYLEYSLDGETFTRDVTYSSESAIYSPLIFTYFGVYSTSSFSDGFKGSIDLSETYIKVNNTVWWQPEFTKVPVQEPNVTNLDTATNNDGVVYNITRALPMKHNVTFYKNKSFEIYTKLLTTSSVADINEIFVVPNVMLLRTWNSNWNPCFYVNGNWEQTSTGSNVYTNSTYYIRCRYFPDTTTVDGKTYTAKNVYFEKSTDNSSWTSIYNTSLATYFFGNDASVTEREIDGAWGAQGTSEIWKGSIDFNTAYIKVDGQIVWNGIANVTVSLPGCTSNFVDTGAATTLNAFVINNTESVVLTPDNTYGGHRFLGTVSIPAHTAYNYSDGVWDTYSDFLIGGKQYYVKVIGGGGGSSTWDGGAGAYWEGFVTMDNTTPVNVTTGGAGAGAAAYSRNHNGVKGGTTSIIGTGITISCEGGQGAIGLRQGDEDGYFSTYTYAPTIEVTDGTVTTIKASTSYRPRRASWDDDTNTGYGAGGPLAGGTKNPGNAGIGGYLEYFEAYTIAILTSPVDLNPTIEWFDVDPQLNPTAEPVQVGGVYLLPEDGTVIYLKVSKEGYQTYYTSYTMLGHNEAEVVTLEEEEEEPQP